MYGLRFFNRLEDKKMFYIGFEIYDMMNLKQYFPRAMQVSSIGYQKHDLNAKPIHLGPSLRPIRPNRRLEPRQPSTHPRLVPRINLAPQKHRLLRRQQHRAPRHHRPRPQQHLLPYTRLAHAHPIHALHLHRIHRRALAILQHQPVHRVPRRLLLLTRPSTATSRVAPLRAGRPRALLCLLVLRRDANHLPPARRLPALHGLELLDLLPAAEAEVLHVDDLHVDVAREAPLLGARVGGGEAGHGRGVEDGAAAAGEIAGEDAGFCCGEERGGGWWRRAGADEGSEKGGGGGREGLRGEGAAQLTGHVHGVFVVFYNMEIRIKVFVRLRVVVC